MSSQASALVRLDNEVVDLDEELQRFLALVRFCREALTAEITSGLGHKQMGVPKGTIAALKELGTTLNSATDCHVRLVKTEKDRQKKWKREDYLLAARRLVLSLDQQERGVWLREMIREHRARARKDRVLPDDRPDLS